MTPNRIVLNQPPTQLHTVPILDWLSGGNEMIISTIDETRPKAARVGGILITTSCVGALLCTGLVMAQTPSPGGGPRMKAIVYHDFGSPDVLRLLEIDKPVPADNQVLVRVRAASVNPLDWHYMEGTPYIARIEFGLFKPKETRLGVDYAGTVESVGKNVTQFKPGDDVFGGGTGAFAEFGVVREDRAVVLKPANLTFEQAASIPIAG